MSSVKGVARTAPKVSCLKPGCGGSYTVNKSSLQPLMHRHQLNLAVIPALPLGLFGFAWTSLGPPKVPWIAPMIFSAIVGIGNVSIWLAQSQPEPC